MSDAEHQNILHQIDNLNARQEKQIDQMRERQSEMTREMGRQAGALEVLADNTTEMLTELRQRFSALKCEAHETLLEKQDQDLAVLRSSVENVSVHAHNKTPTGEVERVAYEAAEEVSGVVRLETLKEAQAAAVKAATEVFTAREDAAKKQREEKLVGIERLLRIATLVMALLGAGSVATFARSCVVQERVAAQAAQQEQTLQSVKREIRSLVGPDATIKP